MINNEERTYFDSKGRIKEIVNMPSSFYNLNDFGNLSWIPGNRNAENYYVLNNEFVERQPFEFIISKTQINADGIDEVLITNIPTGTTIEWPDGQTDEVIDGEVRFSVDLSGTYTLTFSAIPYLDQEVTIEAVSAT